MMMTANFLENAESFKTLVKPLSQRPVGQHSEETLADKSNVTQNDITESGMFTGLQFYISKELLPEEKYNIRRIIESHKGVVVGKRFTGAPDYTIVPLHGSNLNNITSKEVVTMFFIVDCTLTNSVVPVRYYHYPVAFVKDAKPLTGCVISVSNYQQTERDFIEQLIIRMGAVFQPSLARKPKDGVMQSTHLICSETSGSSKYQEALSWGLPIIVHDWLLKCASLGMRVSEEPFLLFGEARHQNSENFKTPLTIAQYLKLQKLKKTSINQAVSRLRNATPGSDSPEFNRTMTPTSPYGAVYSNDNPSPGTRKRLLRSINQGIEFPQDPPMKRWETHNLKKTAETQIQLKIFMLSGFIDPREAKAIIEICGGKISDVSGFDKKATHLISMNFSLNKKLIPSICAGLWVLHPSILDKLRQVRSVYAVSEEQYEWGNRNKILTVLLGFEYYLPQYVKEFAESAYFWREQRKKKSPAMFKDLKVIIHLQEKSIELMKLKLEAGGAEVLSIKPPYQEPIDANLCICDPEVQGLDFPLFVKNNINCVHRKFVFDTILRKCNPIEDYFIPAFANLKNSYLF